jgi:hypothetical protein
MKWLIGGIVWFGACLVIARCCSINGLRERHMRERIRRVIEADEATCWCNREDL